jgi:uncharacterized protein YggE
MKHKFASAIATIVAIAGGTAITSCAQPAKTPTDTAPVSVESEEVNHETAKEEKDVSGLGSSQLNISYDETDRTITVSGNAKTMAEPDRAQIELGLMSDTQKTATRAQNIVANKIDAVKDVLESLGVEKKNVTCSQYSLSPVYDYQTYQTSKNDDQQIVGYESTAVITIENVPLECVSEYISETTDAGADSIADISYTTIEYDDIYNKTLEQALQVAKKKADVLAKAENAKVGKAVSISEGYADTSARYVTANLMDASAGTSNKAAPQIDPEKLEIDANVSVTYTLDY